MDTKYTRLVLPVTLVGLAIGIVVAGYLLYRGQRARCRVTAEHNLTAVADLKVNELSMWRKERAGDARVFYENRRVFGSGAAMY